MSTLHYWVVCRLRGWWMATPKELGRKSVLYRFVVLALLVSSVLQISYFEAPGSVETQTPGYFDVVFMVMQLLGAVLLSVALFWPRIDTRDAAYIELMGCIMAATSGTNYAIAVISQNNGPPLTQGTWLTVAIALYVFLRSIEIVRVAIVVGAIETRRRRRLLNPDVD